MNMSSRDETQTTSRLDTVGTIFDIQRFAVHDGPGIRTTVFCKGCPLACAWCHNPESIRREPDLSYVPERCIRCGCCLEACLQQAHRIEDEVHTLDRERCVVCGACANECPAEALEIVGREITVEEAMREIEADRPFYESSGGGMTLSGGEPTAQFAFARDLLAEAKRRGIHTCLDTCGLTAWERLAALLPPVDLFLYDIKDTDPQRHRRFTGVGNEEIIANLHRLSEAGARIILRCPMIPNVNADDEHLARIAELAVALPAIEEVHLLPYHGLGRSKHARLGTVRPELPAQAPSEADVEGWLARLRELGVRRVATS